MAAQGGWAAEADRQTDATTSRFLRQTGDEFDTVAAADRAADALKWQATADDPCSLCQQRPEGVGSGSRLRWYGACDIARPSRDGPGLRPVDLWCLPRWRTRPGQGCGRNGRGGWAAACQRSSKGLCLQR